MWLNCCNFIQTLTDEPLLLTDKARKWFIEIEFPPGEDTMKTVEVTTRNLEYHIKLVDKAEARFERIDFNFESR